MKNGERSGWYWMSKGEGARQLDAPPLGSFYACCKLGLQVMVGLGNFFGLCSKFEEVNEGGGEKQGILKKLLSWIPCRARTSNLVQLLLALKFTTIEFL